jgi:cell division transport system permease protein
MSHVVREALAAFRRAPVLTALAAAMVALALFVVGLFALAAFNLDVALSDVEARVEVVAYLRDNARNVEIETARAQLSALTEVQEVRFVSKEEALEVARRDIFGVGEVFSELTVNPLPASLEIRLRPGYRTPDVVAHVSTVAGAFTFVEDVTYGRDWVDRLFALRRIAGATVSIFGAAFGVVAALIIATALRIAVFARRDEIHIMRLVGARDGFIRGPFLLEGALTGLLGGLLAALLTYLTFRLIHSLLFTLAWIPGEWVLVGIGAGVAFGVVASGVAVRRHLREV